MPISFGIKPKIEPKRGYNTPPICCPPLAFHGMSGYRGLRLSRYGARAHAARGSRVAGVVKIRHVGALVEALVECMGMGFSQKQHGQGQRLPVVFVVEGYTVLPRPAWRRRERASCLPPRCPGLLAGQGAAEARCATGGAAEDSLNAAAPARRNDLTFTSCAHQHSCRP